MGDEHAHYMVKAYDQLESIIIFIKILISNFQLSNPSITTTSTVLFSYAISTRKMLRSIMPPKTKVLKFVWDVGNESED
jgi:hypothetical protein